MLLLCADIDECLNATYPCDDNATCTNIDGSYNCTCDPGFTGNGTVCEGNNCPYNSLPCSVLVYVKSICTDVQISFTHALFILFADIDECEIGTYQCDSNAECNNIPGGYNCTCKTGYFGNGTECKGNWLYIGSSVVCFITCKGVAIPRDVCCDKNSVLECNINFCTPLPQRSSSSVVRVPSQYPEGPGFKSQIYPDFQLILMTWLYFFMLFYIHMCSFNMHAFI